MVFVPLRVTLFGVDLECLEWSFAHFIYLFFQVKDLLVRTIFRLANMVQCIKPLKEVDLM